MTSRARRVRVIGLVLLLVLLAASVAWLLSGEEQHDALGLLAPPTVRQPTQPESAGRPIPEAAEPRGPAVAPPLPSPPGQRATPRVFDFAKFTPPRGGIPQAEPFPTTPWLTEEDLLHPERYFEMAEHIAELNRPEERRDTLEYFLRFREKLIRDLDTADPTSREKIRSAVARYDEAIARLRGLIAEADSSPTP